jgi:hypothetical protein
VQVRVRGAQLGDERTQAIDAGGRALLVFDDVVVDEGIEPIEVAVVEAALDQGPADLLVRLGRGVSTVMARTSLLEFDSS